MPWSDPEVLTQLFTAACTILGFHFVGRKKAFGWLFNVASGCGWAVLLWYSGQVIMYVPLVMMVTIAIRNFLAWTRQPDWQEVPAETG